jgi:hypothetical protein
MCSSTRRSIECEPRSVARRASEGAATCRDREVRTAFGQTESMNRRSKSPSGAVGVKSRFGQRRREPFRHDTSSLPRLRVGLTTADRLHINTPARCPEDTPERTGPDRAAAHRPGPATRTGRDCSWWSGTRWRRTGSSSRGPSTSAACSSHLPRIVGSLQRPGRRPGSKQKYTNSRGSLPSTRLAGSSAGAWPNDSHPMLFRSPQPR